MLFNDVGTTTNSHAIRIKETCVLYIIPSFCRLNILFNKIIIVTSR
jgi:hypothetical protein